MIARNDIRRAKFFGGASLLALMLAPAPVAFGAPSNEPPVRASDAGSGPVAGRSPTSKPAAEDNRYNVRILTQIFDGSREFSHAQVAAFARVRRGDESWSMVDFGDGAVVIERPGQATAASAFQNASSSEAGFSYDYRTKTIAGTSDVAQYHNNFIRPQLDRAPPLGRDANWQSELSLAALGFAKLSGQNVVLKLNREYFRHDGTDYVLVHYEVPAFSYRLADGRSVVNWGRGVALTDPGFGNVYWNAALHRAVADEPGSSGRPYRLSRSSQAADANGKALVDLRAIPQTARYLDEFYGPSNKEVMAFTDTQGRADQTPVNLAAFVDTMALSIMENGANQLGEMAGWTYGGDRGAEYGAGLDSVVDIWGIPDKFAAAAGGISDLKALEQQVVAQVNAINKLAGDTTDYYRRLSNTLANLERQVKSTDAMMQDAIRAANNIDDLMDGKAAGLADRLVALNAQIRTVRLETQHAEQQVAMLSRVRQQLPGVLTKLGNMNIPGGTVGSIATSITKTLEKVSGPLTFLGGLGNIGEVYGTATNLGSFNPGDQDLKLTGSYDSAGGFISDISLNLVGILGNAAQGNVATTAADTLTFASGRFVDLYKVISAAGHAKRQSQQAQMEYMLTLKRQTLQLTQLEEQKMRELLAQEYGLYTSADPYAGGYDTSDPRIDKATGLPSPSYWAYLKQNDPQALRNMGIDPGAPVGEYRPWPPQTAGGGGGGGGGAPPVDAGPSEEEMIAGLADEINKPQYPTAPPSGGSGGSGGNSGSSGGTTSSSGGTTPSGSGGATTSGGGSTTPAKPGDPPATDDAAPPAGGSGTTTTTQPSGGFSRISSPNASLPGYGDGFSQREYNDKTGGGDQPDGYGGGFDSSPPVEFKPPKWEPPKWDPPKWVPPEFDPPDATTIQFTDFDDADWPGSDDNLAYIFREVEDMAGIVATDLGPWEKWLATQDVRQLTRLALQAGYPNLASALADAENIIRQSQDDGYRQWAMQAPSCGSLAGCGPSYLERWAMKRSTVALGDILAQSRDIFSSGGFSDIGISGLQLSYLLRDHGVQDQDVVSIEIFQFGRRIFETSNHFLLNEGTNFTALLRPGVAEMVITAMNEGTIPPNTAQVQVDNVVRGEGTQTYSLNALQTATLRIESNARPEN